MVLGSETSTLAPGDKATLPKPSQRAPLIHTCEPVGMLVQTSTLPKDVLQCYVQPWSSHRHHLDLVPRHVSALHHQVRVSPPLSACSPKPSLTGAAITNFILHCSSCLLTACAAVIRILLRLLILTLNRAPSAIDNAFIKSLIIEYKAL